MISDRSTRWIAAWGTLGVTAILAEGVCRLGRRALDTVAGGLTPLQWAALALATVLLTYVEGYRAFYLKFAPRVVVRAARAAGGGPWKAALAPLYVLSLFGGSRREIVRGWAALAAVLAAIETVRALPAPWRGIVDGAVCVALAFGAASVLLRLPGSLRAPRDAAGSWNAR